MITYGKRLNKKKIPPMEELYTLWGKEGEEQYSILLSKDKSIEDRIKELKINNAIMKYENNFLRIWVGPRQRKDEGYYYRRQGASFEKDIYVVTNGVVKHHAKLCEICKDKLKGIVDECSTINTWNKQREKACVFNLLIQKLISTSLK